MWMAACGGGHSSSSGSGSGIGTSTNNVQTITVDQGPEPSTFISTNVAYTNVTICVPGTSTCQTIDHIQVDTGSEGLRLLQGVVTLNLPQETVGGNQLAECLVFADGYVWGTVASADITISGEKASSAPVQIIIPSSASPGVPTSCSNQNPTGGAGNEGGSVMSLGANGILGVGPFQNDCGPACTSQNSQIPDVYYSCPSGGCNPTYVTLSQQVPNPVSLFSTDNNGVLIQLPSVPNGGSPTATGSMIFGIGTQSNNALGNATIYQIPDSGNNAGDFVTTFNGQSYPQSFVDSGSNGLFFLDSNTTGIPTCTGNSSASSWYCPTTSPDGLSATNQGQSTAGPVGNAVQVNFTIENANSLFNTSNSAFSTLSGPFSGAFDWGLSFFYGRNVYTAIDTMSTPAGAGPYFAY